MRPRSAGHFHVGRHEARKGHRWLGRARHRRFRWLGLSQERCLSRVACWRSAFRQSRGLAIQCPQLPLVGCCDRPCQRWSFPAAGWAASTAQGSTGAASDFRYLRYLPYCQGVLGVRRMSGRGWNMARSRTSLQTRVVRAQLGARADARSSVSSPLGVPSRAAQLLRCAALRK